MSTRITLTADFYAIRIHIGETLHLHVDRSKLLAVQSWCDHEHSFSVEWVMVGGAMVTEYTDRERWQTILKHVEDIL